MLLPCLLFIRETPYMPTARAPLRNLVRVGRDDNPEGVRLAARPPPAGPTVGLAVCSGREYPPDGLYLGRVAYTWGGFPRPKAIDGVADGCRNARGNPPLGAADTAAVQLLRP